MLLYDNLWITSKEIKFRIPKCCNLLINYKKNQPHKWTNEMLNLKENSILWKTNKVNGAKTDRLRNYF